MTSEISTSPPFPLSALTLGTVQFGMPYGVANPATLPDKRAAEAIFEMAQRGGVRVFDTARAYGLAEQRIGSWLASGGSKPALISKFPPLDPDGDATAAMLGHFEASCAVLGVGGLDGWLAHRVEDIALPGVAEALRALVREGRLGAFGVSVYGPQGIEAALAVEGLCLVQAPASLLDTRLILGGWFERCRAAGLTVFARSAFLQGALLMSADRLPPHLAPLAPHLRAFQDIASRSRLAPATLAIGFLRAQPGIDSIVVGAYDAAQMSACLDAAAAAPLAPATVEALCALGDGLDEALIDPSRWPPAA